MSANPRPVKLSNRENVRLEIAWDDNISTTVSFHELRASCPCAECVNELTGERMLDVAKIAENIHPASVAFVGQYAIRITWSDGHSTGIYTFVLLRTLSSGTASGAA